MLHCQFTGRNRINVKDVLRLFAADGGGFSDEFRLNLEKPLPLTAETDKIFKILEKSIMVILSPYPQTVS
jgi:hypothetical protein